MPRSGRWVLWGVAAVTAAVLLTVALREPSPAPQPSPATESAGRERLVRPAATGRDADPVPEYWSHPPVLPAAEPFVGAQACGECHPQQLESYRQTAHASAFVEVAADEEPADQQYAHDLSGRQYAVYRQEGRLRHRETLSAAPDDPRLAVDLPVRYRVGSGHHSRTYLAEVQGFLMESPITFYESRQTWDMSPGYDQPVHYGFERAADLGCLACHVGQAERVEGALHRLRFHELSISCENCHAGGSEHVALHQSERAVGDDRPDPVINPQKLDRERGESVCANCHLRGAATVLRKGMDLTSFRPGMKLTDVRADFRYQRADDRMNVTGHFDQLWLSRCYTQSDSLTCTSCHDPHNPLEVAVKIEHFRNTCLECHGEADCGVPMGDPRRTDVADNCNHCHMPQVPTDIPHIAFTHHRIGIHKEAEETAPAPAADLEPFLELAGWSEHERRRALALAYLEVPPDALTGNAPQKAERMLRALWREDPQDPSVASALARVLWSTRPTEAIEFADRALAVGALAKDRANALFVVGSLHLQQQQQAHRAQAALQELVKLRRLSEDWLLLSESRWHTGDETGAVTALETAISINPFRPELHETLGRLRSQDGGRSR